MPEDDDVEGQKVAVSAHAMGKDPVRGEEGEKKTQAR